MGKDSFILYTDQKHLLEKLSPEQGYFLMLKVFEYAENRKAIIIEDPLVDMAFTAFKTSIDRNHEKYTKILEKRREGGRLGGRPRKKP